MRHLQFFTLLISFFLTCCQSPNERSSISGPIPDPGNKGALQPRFQTHLQDTTYVEGSFILFLRPDNPRYAELQSTYQGIGDVDGDFGVGIGITLDSLYINPEYKKIKGLVSTNRYIYIKDCMGGPLVIDRDTTVYGFIMSAKGKPIARVSNSVHSGDYLEEIDSYFLAREI